MSYHIQTRRRILIVDEADAIHRDLRSCLDYANATPAGRQADPRADLIRSCVGAGASESETYDVDSAFDAKTAIELVTNSIADANPYSLAFVDVDKPLGCARLKTIQHLWEIDSRIQVVICSAFVDHKWDDVIESFGDTDQLLVVKKPFDNIVIRQLARSLTKKWQFAQNSRLHMAELEHVIAERIADLSRTNEALQKTNEELRTAQEVVLAANQAKSDFLANMSHEIRSPMTAIIGYTEFLIEEGDPRRAPPARLQALQTILRNGNHLLQIINDILDVSKIEAGKMVIETLDASPLQIVNDVIDLMRTRAEERGISLRANVEGPVPNLIRTDPTRLRQILVNLVGNAIKFTERGGVLVSVRLHDENEVPKLEFEVTDTGIGLSDEQIARLFKPFSQAEGSTSRKFGGTGLGLSICRRLAEMLGGEISVNSTFGEGSTFRFSVSTGSLAGRRMVKTNRPTTPTTVETNSAPDKLPYRILLAEDGPDNQRLIRHILSKAGATVTVVGDGKKAVDEVTSTNGDSPAFDLVLMDMQMPVMDGYEATKLIRSLGHSIPIIALTANAMSGDRDKCIDAGCSDYLSKPIDRAVFVPTIARLLATMSRESTESATIGELHSHHFDRVASCLT